MKLSAFFTASLVLSTLSVPAYAQAQGGLNSLLLSPPPVASTSPAAASSATIQAPVIQGALASPNAADEQFQRALQSAVPYTPEQIEEYRRQMDAATRASVTPLVPGTPISRSLRLSLKPGEQTPVLRVQPGVVSTLTFSDLTGQPWPVLSVVTGNPTAFVAQSAGEPGKSNIIVLSSIQSHVPSNMVVTLVDYPVPITIALNHGASEVDYRLDVQVTARGPNAEHDLVGVSTLAPTNDSNMLSFLDGVPPPDALRLRTNSGDVEAWAYGDMVYVRTPGEVSSPAYISRASNVSGVNIFVMQEAPVILVSKDGRMNSVQIIR